MERNRPLRQIYENYTREDFAVWQLLFDRQTGLLDRYASKSYIRALARVGFTAADIPRFDHIENKLQSLTGWRISVVPGHVPARDFFAMLADRIFPATCWLRTMKELDYIEEPDMFHDVYGHVPLLANEAYASFMQAFGNLALRWYDNPAAVEILSRIYWFTIEFGLIEEAGDIHIYGAGILSSPGETQYSMSDKPLLQQFDTHEVVNTSFRTDIIQERYFVINSFLQLKNILVETEHILLNTDFSRSGDTTATLQQQQG